MATNQTATSEKMVDVKVIAKNFRHKGEPVETGKPIKVTEQQAVTLRKHKFVE